MIILYNDEDINCLILYLSNTTPSKHLSSNTAYTSDTNDGYCHLTDALVILDDSHALQSHKPAAEKINIYYMKRSKNMNEL